MEHGEPSTDGNDVLNANRNVVTEKALPPTATAPRSESPTPAVAPVVHSFDWKKFMPWLLGIVLLLLIVWLITRKRGNGAAPSA